MKAHLIIHPSSNKHKVALIEFEEALYNSMLHYSLRHLAFTGNVSQENISDALQKVLQIC